MTITFSKTKLKMRILAIPTLFLLFTLMLAQTVAAQNNIFDDVEDFAEQAQEQAANSVDEEDLLSGYGGMCVENSANCPSGFVGVIEALSNGDIEVVSNYMDTTDAINDFRAEWETDTRLPSMNKIAKSSLCISNQYKYFVPIAVEDQDPKFKMRTQQDTSRVLRACPIGEIGQEAIRKDLINTGSVGGQSRRTMFGCCPVGYQVTTIKATDNLRHTLEDSQKNLTCCPVPPGTNPEGDNYPYYTEDGQCYDINEELIDYEGEGDPAAIADAGLKEQGGFDLGWSGLLDEDYNAGRTLISHTQAEEIQPFSCDSVYNDGCVVLSNGQVASPDVLDEASQNSCVRCYANGSAISLEGEKLAMCAGNGKVEKIDLVNGNINDTIAFLNADETNQPLLQDCRESGGLYVAIGCIDPTPVGIITGLIRITFGVIGGVALIQLILAGIAYQSGNEEQIQEAQKRLFATIGGVALLVFSVLILRIIGVNVLDVIPEGSI